MCWKPWSEASENCLFTGWKNGRTPQYQIELVVMSTFLSAWNV
jgi:hypothetical protein